MTNLTTWWKEQKAFSKFLMIIGVFFVVGLGASLYDGANPDINIPLIPDLTINGMELPELKPAGPTITADQFQEELREAFPNLRSYKILLVDRTFQPVDHDSALDLIDFSSEFYRRTPKFRFTNEGNDCDNFSRRFLSFADLAGGYAFKGQLAFVKIYVEQKHSWARVPAGGAHSLTALRTSEGIIVYEPQGRRYICADDYPNRDYVFQVNGD
jgi:hypothetical protein